jgi:amino acid transporter
MPNRPNELKAHDLQGKELLKPKVGMLVMLFMAVGIIAGPWMPQMPFWFSLSGPSIMLAFLAIALLSVPIIFTYGELVAMLPFSGGEAQYARNAFGRNVGWLTGWFLIMLYLMATAFMGPATARMVQVTGGLFSLSDSAIGLMGIGLIALIALLNTFSIAISARVQFVMVAILLIVGWGTPAWFVTTEQWTMTNLSPFFATGMGGWFIAVGILVTMVLGFDCIPQMAEEANYPRRKMVKTMLLAVIISEVMYAFICFGNAGMMPSSWISEQLVVSPEIARPLAGNGVATIMNLAGLAACLTSLNGFMIAGSRVMVAMSRARILPPFLAHVNKWGVPDRAIWFTFVICALLVGIAGEGWLETLFISSAFMGALVYLLASASAGKLRKSHPEWPRPYKMPWGIGMSVLAVIISIFIASQVALGMPPMSWLIFVIMIAIGAIIYGYMRYKAKKDPSYEEIVLTPDDISADTQ